MLYIASNELWLLSVDGFFSASLCCYTRCSFGFFWFVVQDKNAHHHPKKHKQTHPHPTKRILTNTAGHNYTLLFIYLFIFYWFLALCEKNIDKYLEYLPAETLKLNWAELRQMRCSKLNKQSSLLGDSTMVIRVSCELPYIIYGCAVGCLQLNRPTVHWLGILWEADSKREGGELKMALFPLEEVHFHLNEGGSPKRVVSRPCACKVCWLCSSRLLCITLLHVSEWYLQNLTFVRIRNPSLPAQFCCQFIHWLLSLNSSTSVWTRTL